MRVRGCSPHRGRVESASAAVSLHVRGRKWRLYPRFPGLSVCSHEIRRLAGCTGLVRKRLPRADSSHLFVRRPSSTFISNFRQKIPLGFWVDNVPAMSFISWFLLLISWFAIQVETCLSAVTFSSSPPPPLLPQSIIFLIHHLAITPVSLVLSLQMWQLISSGKYQLEQCRSDTTPLPLPPSPAFASLGPIGREQSPQKHPHHPSEQQHSG